MKRTGGSLKCHYRYYECTWMGDVTGMLFNTTPNESSCKSILFLSFFLQIYRITLIDHESRIMS